MTFFTMNRLLPRLALLLGLLSASARADLVVLQYHHISDTTPAATSTSVALFEAQLDLIAELGMKVVSLTEGTRSALAATDRSNQVAITFDDAYSSVYTTAAPKLHERGYAYTIFVNTDAVGRPGYMTWEQLQELAARTEVSIGNHSADHAHLPRRPDEPADAWRRRISHSLDRAQEVLGNRLGTDEPIFAYPYGEFDAALEAEVAARGWFGYGQHSGPIGPGSSPTRLPRFPMADAFGQLPALRNKLRSLAFPIDTSNLPDGIITDNPPPLSLTLPEHLDPGRLTCFASGMGRISSRLMEDGSILVTAAQPFNSRRFRYNCTYPAGHGRYYWLSQPWLDLHQPED